MMNLNVVLPLGALVLIGLISYLVLRPTKSKPKPDYLDEHGCDSCCPSCLTWESDGNTILTSDNEDGTYLRRCGKCNHVWDAIFTPAGFIPLSECTTPKTKKETQHGTQCAQASNSRRNAKS